jgi:ATP-dependent exoDNAse (exonuclease V) beta subunit
MSEVGARADEAARTAAVEPAASILLEAPAGSGKTAVLTQRFLRLLCTVEDPGEILAITFTRKAAAEMRARVIGALRGEFGAGDPGAQRLRPLAQAALAHGAARGWRLDAEPQSLRIQTIDSFNYWLASQLPVAARTGGALNVTESAAPLYQRAARRTLTDAERDPALTADAQLLFERLDNHWMNLERLIAQMLHERGHWLRFVAGEDPANLTARVDATLAALTRARLAALCDLLPEGLRRRARALPGCGELGAAPADLPHWKHLAHLVLTRDDWRQQLSAQRLGPAFADRTTCQALRDLIGDLVAIPGVRDALLALRRAPPAQLAGQDATAIAALSRLLSRAAAELHTEFAASQRVDYTYVAGAARAALSEQGEPTDLALRTGLALRHILVDEFQDTSLAQVQLLEMLTAGWEAGDGRTLFVVGDPMQSIYRFRDAEVGLFLRARDRGIGSVRLQPLRLARNFRATPELVAFANEVFAEVFPPADDLSAGAVRYRPSLAAQVGTAARGPVPPVTLRRFTGRAHEAQAIAAHVAELKQVDPCSSVAILVVAHAHAVPLIDALAARALPALGVDLVPLRERMIVRDLVELTRALYDLADRAAWLAVLRAPWCGARLRSLSALSVLDDRELVIQALASPQRLARCDPDDRPRLARVHEILTAALTARGSGSVADWLESTWLRLGASDAYHTDELADARAFFDALAARATALEWRGPEDLGALLENLYSAPPAADNAVQVMTVHRAKGLEFDHVIVPTLDRATRGAERRLLRWIDLPAETGESNLLIAPTPPVERREESDLDVYLKDLIRQRDSYERGRLLYVAATRARRTLWLSAAPVVSNEGVVKPDRRSLLAPIWPVLGERFEPVAAPDQSPAGPPRAAPLTRLAAGWAPAAVPAATPLVRLPAAYLAGEPPEFSWVGETQRHIGTIVHGWLERLTQQPTLPAAETVRAQLERLGVPARDEPRAVDVILEALRRTLADERGRWILSAAHREARSEWQLSGVSAGRLRSVKIDRSFIDAGGTRWVIDFKTSSHEGGGLEAFIEREIERYRPQLESYADLVAAVGPEPVRAALYFPLLGIFRESERS